jgi:zinc/manganese transport system substrate-binding protein
MLYCYKSCHVWNGGAACVSSMLHRLVWVLVFAAGLVSLATAAEPPLTIVAAENFYADIARQIGGDRVTVSSIMNNPDQDPHLFETTPGVVKQIAGAQIAIVNGADYDPWMEKVLAASTQPNRKVIVAAELVHKKSGDNPHLWYDSATMPAVAEAIAAALSAVDAGHAGDYSARLNAFRGSLKPLNDKVAAIRGKFAGSAITATESVFGPMAGALGLQMRNERFQLAVQNDTEPSARDIAALEDDLKQRKVKVLLYNRQVSGKLAQRLVDVARQANVAVVGITETQPAGVSFQDWLLRELDALEKALGGSNS